VKPSDSQAALSALAELEKNPMIAASMSTTKRRLKIFQNITLTKSNGNGSKKKLCGKKTQVSSSAQQQLQ
jgi:hypothetical protein